jgi:phage virion morphogenesis protein
MSDPIRIEIDSRPVLAALQRLASSAADPAPALREIGEALVETTKHRFDTSTGPGGERWAENSDLTLLRYLDSFKGSRRKKDGGLTTKGAARLGAKKPLIGETRSLSSTIDHVVTGNVLEIGSPMEYAGVQHFGARRGAFGTTRRGAPIPWGDIPARPFLGLSDPDQDMVLEIIQAHLSRALGTP